MKAEEARAEALHRAQTGTSLANDLAVIEGFAERGIEATPRVDVFTYNAWKAQGRQVKKGEKGLRIQTFIKRESKRQTDSDGNPKAYTMPRTVSVFHISQTKGANE